MIAVLFISGIAFIGAAILVSAIKHAPEGFEDESGFNLVWSNNHAEARNVSCLWVAGSEECHLDRGPAGQFA